MAAGMFEKGGRDGENNESGRGATDPVAEVKALYGGAQDRN